MGKDKSKSQRINHWLEEVDEALSKAPRDSSSCSAGDGGNKKQTGMSNTESFLCLSPLPEHKRKQRVGEASAQISTSSKSHPFYSFGIGNAEQTKAAEMAPKRGAKRARQTAPGKQQSEGGEGTKKTNVQTEEEPEVVEATALEPTSPTTTSKNTRVRLYLLAYAKPWVRTQPFGVMKEKPDAVMEIFRAVVEAKDIRLDDALSALVSNRYPSEVVPPASNISDKSVSEYTEFFGIVSDVYDTATQAMRNLSHEAAWSNVALKVLGGSFNLPSANGKRGSLDIMEAQSVSIGPASLLPRIDGQVPPFKIDLLMVFGKDHEEINSYIEPVVFQHPGFLFSPTEEPEIGSRCQLAAIEVKSVDGAYPNSLLRMSTWLAASLEKVRLLLRHAASLSGDKLSEPDVPLPFIGVSVVGPTWLLHVAAKQGDGNVTIYGPIHMGDTLSFQGILQLFHVLRRIKVWGDEVYWPWLRDNILVPLGKDKAEQQQETVASASGHQQGSGVETEASGAGNE